LFQTHEVFVDVEESGSVVTWDFDVMRQDINFNVLRLLIEIQSSTLLSCARGIYELSYILCSGGTKNFWKGVHRQFVFN